MVRVFRCHNFKRSTVVPVAEEPLAVFSDGDLVFVATRDCCIRVYKPDEDGGGFSEWRCLSTICAVEKLAYNRHKDYIITLEQKKSWTSTTRYVRVYLNWQVDVPKSSKQRTKVRIAGKAHTLHSSANYTPQIEIIELSVDGTVTAIGVCKLTGNFAIAFGREVKLHHIVEKTLANSDRTYRDVEPFLELCWNFEVHSVALSEEFLVCCSHNEVQAIRITYAEVDSSSPRPHRHRVRSPVALERSGSSTRGETPLTARSPSNQTTSKFPVMFSLEDVPGESPSPDIASYRSVSPASTTGQSTSASSVTQMSFTPGVSSSRAIVDDEFYQEWSFEPDDDLLDTTEDTSRTVTNSKMIYLNSLHCGSPHVRHQAAPPVLRDFRGGPVKSSSGVSAKTLLYLSDVRDQDDWLSVTLIPSHLPEQELRTYSPLSYTGSNPVRSAFLPLRCSVCCYVSSRRGGYLYRLSPGSSLVSTYRYTHVANKVVVGPHLLQVVTKTGIETYSARWGAVALAVTEEAEEVRPPSSLDICMCGLNPFFGAVDISHGKDVVLLTKVEAQKGQDDGVWNLYVLENCSVAELYHDMCQKLLWAMLTAWPTGVPGIQGVNIAVKMVTFASHIEETGPASYLHILQEAHLLLRWELRQQATPHLFGLFQESCALLGEFFSRPRQDDWHLCLPYYQKSEMSVANIVRQAVQNRLRSKEQTSVYVYGRGMMAYLDWALFHSDIPLEMKPDISTFILEIYSQSSPESLPSLLLLSRLDSYDPEMAQRLLRDLCDLKESRGEQSSTMDRLANVKVQLLLCDPQAAEVELSSLDKGELVDICASHPEIIHTTTSEFTPLGQLMRRHTPSTLLEILAEIVGGGTITLEACLLLLENNCDVARCQNSQVREFLEIVLNDARRKLWFDEAAVSDIRIFDPKTAADTVGHVFSMAHRCLQQSRSILCEIYIQRLLLGLKAQPQQQMWSGPVKFHLPSGNGHFASRFSWLDYVPPVSSPSALSAPCPHIALLGSGGLGIRTTSMPVPVVVGAGGGRRGGGEDSESCTCAFCVQDLLKLQSLLSSDYASPELVKQVQGLVDGRADMMGWDSVWILCNCQQETKGVTEFVVDKYPRVVAKFAASAFGRDLEKWQLLLRCLEGRLREVTPSESGDRSSDPDQQTVLSAYRDVLDEMVDLFPAETFLMALPADGSLWFLLPFITRSLQRKQLSQLKGQITNKGKDLLTKLATQS